MELYNAVALPATTMEVEIEIPVTAFNAKDGANRTYDVLIPTNYILIFNSSLCM